MRGILQAGVLGWVAPPPHCVRAPLLFIHSVDGHSGSSSSALVNSAAVDICLLVFLWTHTFVYREGVPRSEIAGRIVTFANMLRSCQAAFEGSCTIPTRAACVRGLHILPSTHCKLVFLCKLEVA